MTKLPWTLLLSGWAAWKVPVFRFHCFMCFCNEPFSPRWSNKQWMVMNIKIATANMVFWSFCANWSRFNFLILFLCSLITPGNLPSSSYKRMQIPSFRRFSLNQSHVQARLFSSSNLSELLKINTSAVLQLPEHFSSMIYDLWSMNLWSVLLPSPPPFLILVSGCGLWWFLSSIQVKVPTDCFSLLWLH